MYDALGTFRNSPKGEMLSHYPSVPRVGEKSPGVLARLGILLAEWSERWFPDALVMAMIATVIVFLAGLSLGSKTLDLVIAFGDGFWQLIPFTLQVAMMVVSGFVVATSPPVARAIRRVATIPRSPRGAIALVALFSTAGSLISWGVSFIFSILLAREVAQEVPGTDYRALGAATYLGTGLLSTLGFSSNAALFMTTRESIPPALLRISGVIPLTDTIFAWQNIVTALILVCVSVSIAYFSAPPISEAKTADSFGIKFEARSLAPAQERTPGEWLEQNGLLTVPICFIGFAYLFEIFRSKGPLSAIDLNTLNLFSLMLGLLLHWKPGDFKQAVTDSVPATAGILIQFPFYAGIFGMMTKSRITDIISRLFVGFSTQGSFPLLVAVYSAFLGFFIPSGGSKWLIEAPYVLQAANQLHVNLGWVVQIYNTSEALPNLINPFWMLPLLGLLRLRARDIVGYCMLQLLVNFPLVLFLMWFFARSVPYIPPKL